MGLILVRSNTSIFQDRRQDIKCSAAGFYNEWGSTEYFADAVKVANKEFQLESSLAPFDALQINFQLQLSRSSI